MLLSLATPPSSMATPGHYSAAHIHLVVNTQWCVVGCSLCLTKLDILDDFDEVKVGVAYMKNGTPIEGMPGI